MAYVPAEGLAIRRVPLDSLHLDPANARSHPTENLEAILGSLKRFGQAEPLVVQKSTARVIGGNGRLLAMKKLEWQECDIVEVDVDDLTATALGIALNRSGELAAWDEPALAKLLEGQATTWCTPGHLWNVKLAEAAADWWCVYLMRLGSWWRIGKSRMLGTWGFGVKNRLYTEGGEEAWILSVHPSSLEAAIHEQVALAEYGIPTVTWSESAKGRRTIANVRDLFDRLDLQRMYDNALRVLSDHGRSVEHPCVRSARTHEKISRRVPFLIRACNLLPGLMTVPVPRGGHKTSWEPIRAIDRQPFEGDVFSMDVACLGHYVADGIVTHNCFYGWREGAGHEYLGPANATDVWSVKKVNPQSMIHLTEKPVELARRAILYSSRSGENVLDLFGGSGSTLIACEETERKAYLMEIDCPYADVILNRWEKFAAKEAILDGTGKTFREVALERREERVSATGDEAGPPETEQDHEEQQPH